MATHEILGMGPYREGASIAFGVPYNQVTNSQRAIFKERFALLACGLEMSSPVGSRQIRPEDAPTRSSPRSSSPPPYLVTLLPGLVKVRLTTELPRFMQ
jgi:hypothetical protein